ncbi:MAG: putative immunity protein [Sphaerochaetaceae bacterium]
MGIRKTLGSYDSPYIISLRNLIKTQSKETVASWCLTYCEEVILPIFETYCPADKRPHRALAASQAWFAGTMKLPEVKDIILNQCHATARELEQKPAAQAAARACGQVASCCHIPLHALGLAFYGTAAIAYDRLGVDQGPEIYEQVAAEECEKMEVALRAIMQN